MAKLYGWMCMNKFSFIHLLCTDSGANCTHAPGVCSYIPSHCLTCQSVCMLFLQTDELNCLGECSIHTLGKKLKHPRINLSNGLFSFCIVNSTSSVRFAFLVHQIHDVYMSCIENGKVLPKFTEVEIVSMFIILISFWRLPWVQVCN